MVKASAEDRHDVFDISRLLNTLWRGRVVLALCAVLSVISGGYYIYVLATPVYTASTLLVLETREEQVVDLGGVIGGLSSDTSVVNTELEVLRSRNLIGDVVDKLNLVEDPEFNIKLAPPSRLSLIRGTIRQAFQGWGSTLSDEISRSSQDAVRDAVISNVKSKVSVRNMQRSLAFAISFSSNDPKKAAVISDTLAEAYIFDQVNVKLEAATQASEWLSKRVATLKSQLEQAEKKVSLFRFETELISEEQLKSLEIQLKTLRERIQDSATRLSKAQDYVSLMQDAQGNAEKYEITKDAILGSLIINSSADGGTQEEFDKRFSELLEISQNSVNNISNQLKSLQASFHDVDEEFKSQNSDLISLQQLEREAGTIRQLYEYFLRRLNETSAQEGIQQADSRIISQAVIPHTATAPDKANTLLLSLFMGILMGVSILLYREIRTKTFRTAEQLEDMFSIGVIGQIPKFSLRGRDRIIEYLGEKTTSYISEAMRDLRTSILMSNLQNPPKTIMVTSCQPAEGKTTVSFSMAQNFAQMGKKTLLIEGDFRRRVFSESIDTGHRKGVADFLSGSCRLDEVIFPDKNTGADILLAGEIKENPADFFSSSMFKDMIMNLKLEYDHIVIDTPPVLAVTDARVISDVVDYTAFVVRWDYTSRFQVSSAVRELRAVNCEISGFVLNQIDPAGIRRYGYEYGNNLGQKYYNN